MPDEPDVMRGQVPAGLRIVQDGDVISSDGVRAAVQGMPSVWYQPRDYIFQWIRWTGTITVKPWPLLPAQRRVAVIGRSDGHLTEAMSRRLQRFGVRYIYATNVDPVAGLAEAIPLGVTNFTDESPRHRVFGDNEHFVRAYEAQPQQPEYTGSIYCNITVRNAPQHRQQALDAIAGLPNIEYAEADFSANGRINFLSSLRRCNFVLSPQGNGVDTHRTWETLYMGGIPIVRRHRSMTSLLEALPALLVDDWRELRDSDFLRESWERIRTSVWDLRSLRQSYWVDQIGAKAAELNATNGRAL